MSRVYMATLTAVAALLSNAPGAASAHECDAILQQGLRNTFEELRSGDFRNSFDLEYCSRNSNSKGSTSGSQVGGSYAGYGLNFGSNSGDTSQSRSENCGNSSSSMSDANYVKAMQAVADSKIVEAWSQCRSSAYGVMINGELNGEDIIITYIFRSAGSINKATVDGEPYISGAKCNTAVKDGTVINTGGRVQICKRTTDSPVSIAINTDFQPARFFIPAVIKERTNSSGEKAVKEISLEEMCKSYQGPGEPVECLGKRNLPGVGVAPPGYTWCIIDSRFLGPDRVQGYCLSKEEQGTCYCAKVPSGMPQPSMNTYGKVYQGI